MPTASVDFQLKDDGSATATLTPVDAAGLDAAMPAGATVPVWVSSNAAVVVTAAADGMTAAVKPSVPPVLVTGVTITATATLADGTTVLTGTSDPIDVVGDVATGFRITEK